MISQTLASILQKKGHEIHSVAPDAPVHEAIAIMAEKGVAAVLVLAEGDLVGIVSAKDYGRRVVLLGRSAKDTRVQEIMTHPVVTVTLDVSMTECMGIMTHYHIRHLPVFNKSELVGVVSMGDLVSAVISDQEFHIDQLMRYMGQK